MMPVPSITADPADPANPAIAAELHQRALEEAHEFQRSSNVPREFYGLADQPTSEHFDEMVVKAQAAIENEKPLSKHELKYLRKPGHSRLTMSGPIKTQTISDLFLRGWVDANGKLTESGTRMRDALGRLEK